MLIQALVSSKLYIEANGALKELAIKDPSWSSRGLLEKSLIQKIAHECNLDFETIWNSGRKQHNNDDDMDGNHENEDEIQEEFE